MKRTYTFNRTVKVKANSPYYTQTQKMSFRTLLKRRNQTINSSQLYERSPLQKLQNSTKNMSLSNVSLAKDTSNRQSQGLNIKDYVKSMGNKNQQRIVETRKTSRQAPLMRDNDTTSVKSSRSILSTSINPKEFNFLEEKTQARMLDDLQQKIQLVTTNIFRKILSQKSSIGLSKWNQLRGQKSVEKEFEEIRQWFAELKEKSESKSDQKMEDLSRKIAMIEKMIAAENVESQVLKKQYSSWKNQRANTASFASKRHLAQSIKYNGEDKIKRQLFSVEKPKQIVAQYNSSSSLFYRKPARQSYNTSIAKKNTYSVNRQPMPRSSYSTEFLNYGYFPTYCYKQANSRQLPEVSLAVKASNYQQQYKQKLGINKTVDFKELDCFKDKFKNTNISFMNTSKKDYVQLLMKKKHNKQNKQLQQSTHREIKKSQESLIGCMTSSLNCQLARTEHQKQFIWHNAIQNDQTKSSLLKSEIKDKHLSKMKDNFRKMAVM